MFLEIVYLLAKTTKFVSYTFRVAPFIMCQPEHISIRKRARDPKGFEAAAYLSKQAYPPELPFVPKMFKNPSGLFPFHAPVIGSRDRSL